MSLICKTIFRNTVVCGKLSQVHLSKPDPRIPKNAIEHLISAQNQSQNGAIYDKKPFKVALVQGKRYSWCLCGRSKNQPFCDGTHRSIYLKITQKPIAFEVSESKDYWLCQCKHTKNRPFCDGAHKEKTVQEQSSTIRQ